MNLFRKVSISLIIGISEHDFISEMLDCACALLKLLGGAGLPTSTVEPGVMAFFNNFFSFMEDGAESEVFTDEFVLGCYTTELP